VEKLARASLFAVKRMNNLPLNWPLRFTANIVVVLCAIIGAETQIASASGQAKSSIPEFGLKKSAPLTIDCIAEPGFIRPGDVSRIVTTAVSAQNRPITYSYSVSAGTIGGNGATALFSSTGVPVGAVEIACRVSDDLGRTATATTTVVIRTPSKAIPPQEILIHPTMTGIAPTRPALPPPPKSVHTPSLPSTIATPTTIKSAPVHQPAPAASTPESLSKIAQDQSAKFAATAPSSEYAEGYALEAWKKNLKEGHIDYFVKPDMKAQMQSPVTVRIHGFQDVPGAQPLPATTGSGTLKVSSYMKVELLAPLNPGEFTIAPQGNEAIQFVPNDGSATWNWVVTPAYAAMNQQLEIRVSLVYKRPDTTLEDLLVDTNYTVNVDVQKLSTTLWQDFQKDPIAFIKYMLPGGAGWGALAALVTSLGGFAWWKRKKKKAAPRHTGVK